MGKREQALRLRERFIQEDDGEILPIRESVELGRQKPIKNQNVLLGEGLL